MKFNPDKEVAIPWWESILIGEVDAQGGLTLEVNPHVIALLKRINPDTRCPECKGLGETFETLIASPFPSWMTCKICNGTGVYEWVGGRLYWVVLDRDGWVIAKHWNRDSAKIHADMCGGVVEKRFTQPGDDMEGMGL